MTVVYDCMLDESDSSVGGQADWQRSHKIGYTITNDKQNVPPQLLKWKYNSHTTVTHCW